MQAMHLSRHSKPSANLIKPFINSEKAIPVTKDIAKNIEAANTYLRSRLQ